MRLYSQSTEVPSCTTTLPALELPEFSIRKISQTVFWSFRWWVSVSEFNSGVDKLHDKPFGRSPWRLHAWDGTLPGFLMKSQTHIDVRAEAELESVFSSTSTATSLLASLGW